MQHNLWCGVFVPLVSFPQRQAEKAGRNLRQRAFGTVTAESRGPELTDRTTAQETKTATEQLDDALN